MPDNITKANRRTMNFIRHMLRSAFFPRQAGRPDNGNYLESGEVRGNMLTRLYSRLVQFMGVSCNGI